METKKAATIHGKSYHELMKDKNHRIQYHRSQCDPTKMHRGGTLLPLHHPAMTPTIFPSDRSPQTSESLQGRANAIETSKQNTINYLKTLRKK